MFRKEIIVTAPFEGMHAWAGAPDEVSFLQYPHRHVFHVRLGIPVSYDREREFFIEQRKLKQVLDHYNGQPNCSCEQIAEDVLRITPYASWCEVWEDNENGSRVERIDN